MRFSGNIFNFVPLMFRKALLFCLCTLVFAGSLLPNSDLCELKKIPLLLFHYYEHSHENTDLSFGDFLQMHYDNQERNASAAEHENLPFFSHCNVMLFFTCPEIRAIDFYTSLAAPVYTVHPYRNYSLLLGASIFQPPKRG